jgi:serine/threonine protein kinase
MLVFSPSGFAFFHAKGDDSMLETARVLQDRYRLDRALGKAAGRQTWLATDLTCQEAVVVKLLTFSDQVQWDNLRLFEREAAILKQLDHPRIPQYRDYFCIDDRLLWFGLVQQYIPGISLKDLLARRGPITAEQAQDVAVSILEILTYLHGLSPPVLHRDIKPSNIILGEDQQIYLVDFGAVQDRAAAAGATFTVVGTYGYAPLEQFGGRAAPASDLYALGASLIHLLTGTVPADLPQYQGQMQFADQVSLHPGFVRWLKRLTEPNLEKRFRTAEQALEKLDTVQMAGAIVRSQPPNSRIKLTKSSQQLKVKLLSSWSGRTGFKRIVSVISLLFLPLLLFLFLGAGYNTAMLLTSLMSFSPMIVVSALNMLPSIIIAEICFDHQHFEIRWKLLGLCIYQQRGDVGSIDRVFNDFSKPIAGVILGVGIHEYTLTAEDSPFSEAECNWLANEIADWLGL